MRPAVLVFLVMTGLSAAAQTTEQSVSHIKLLFREVNAAKDLQLVRLDNDDFISGTDRGSSLTGYYRGSSLVKMVAWIGVSHWIYITEYYFEAGKLMFAYHVQKTFVYDEKKGDVDESKTEDSFTGRYYFANDLLVSKQMHGHDLLIDEHTNMAKSLTEEALKYSALLRSSKK